MLTHTVFFWLRKDLTPAQRATFETELHQLTKLSYLARCQFGPPAAVEKRPVTDASFDFGLLVEFKTLADHDFYQAKCPDHARFVATCKSLWERVVVYDFTPRA
jgi:hypothetical protein